MSVWKRNAVVVAIVLFVGAAVYLNWSYNQQASADGTEGDGGGRVLGQTELVNGPNSSASPTAGPSGTQEPDDGNGGGQGNSGAVNQSTGYFASARLNRQQARDSALELLRQAAADANAQQSIIDSANASIQAMATFTMSEAQVENLVTAKGYGDCICFISENSASVVVAGTANSLTDSDIARILEIVKEETGLPANNIRIIATEP